MSGVSIARDGSGDGWLVSGRLDFSTAGQALDDELIGAALQADTVIDLSGVEYIDSAGLAVLLEWLRRARERGVKLRFSNIPEEILPYARVCGVEPLLPTTEAA